MAHAGSAGRTAIAAAQGLFYVATGVWPLISRRTFERVTGPKTDFWLVNTVGVLVGVAGGVLLSAAARRRVGPEIAALGAGSALGLAAIDVVYAARGVIGKVYLLDAGVELGFAGAWAVTALRPRALPR